MAASDAAAKVCARARVRASPCMREPVRAREPHAREPVRVRAQVFVSLCLFFAICVCVCVCDKEGGGSWVRLALERVCGLIKGVL